MSDNSDREDTYGRHWALLMFALGLLTFTKVILGDWGVIWLAIGVFSFIGAVPAWTRGGKRKFFALDGFFDGAGPLKLQLISNLILTTVLIASTIIFIQTAYETDLEEHEAPATQAQEDHGYDEYLAEYERKYANLNKVLSSIVPQADRIALRLRDPDLSAHDREKLIGWITRMEQASIDISCKLTEDGRSEFCGQDNVYLDDLDEWNALYERTMRDSEVFLATP